MPGLTEATVITVRTVKHALGNPSYAWVNTYEAELNTPQSDPDEWRAFAEAIIDAESTLHTENVIYERCVISTSDREAVYSPYNLFVHAYVLAGVREIVSDGLSRNVVLFVRRNTEYGRGGKLFYRGALAEADVQGSSALDMVLTSGATTALDALVGGMSADFDTALETLGGVGSRFVIRAWDDEGNVKYDQPVTALVLGGVRFNSPDHRYYDLPA